jgi:hypothetical protein
MSSPSISNLPPQPLNSKPAAIGPLGGLDEDRAGVAQPDVAERAAHDLDGGVGQQGASGGLGLVADHHQAHALGAGTGQSPGQVGHFLLGDRQGLRSRARRGWESPPTSRGAAPTRRERSGSCLRNLIKNGRRKWPLGDRGSSVTF